MSYQTSHELVVNAQSGASVPAHAKDKALDLAFIDIAALESFCMKYGKTPPEVIARFLAVDPDDFDEDKRVVLMREQARLGLDCMKSFKPADGTGMPNKIEITWGAD